MPHQGIWASDNEGEVDVHRDAVCDGIVPDGVLDSGSKSWSWRQIVESSCIWLISCT
jgi:hypothetical protein